MLKWNKFALAFTLIGLLFTFSACNNDKANKDKTNTNATQNDNTPNNGETSNGDNANTATPAPAPEEKLPFGKISETKFNFEHFMLIDLEAWTEESSKKFEEGDAWGVSYVYKKGDQTLEFTDGISSYGYNQDYKLYGAGKKLLKERSFFYANGFMQETIRNHETQKRYTREKETTVKYDLWESKDKPLVMEGEWQELSLGN